MGHDAKQSHPREVSQQCCKQRRRKLLSHTVRTALSSPFHSTVAAGAQPKTKRARDSHHTKVFMWRIVRFFCFFFSGFLFWILFRTKLPRSQGKLCASSAFFAKFNQTSLHWISLLHNKLQHHSYYLLHYALAFARLANAEASLSPTWSRRFRRTISIPTHTQTGSTKSGADQSRNFAS